MTEYRKITADELTETFTAVEIYSPATGEWIPAEARVARMSSGAEVISTQYRNGGTSVEPKSHGITARIPVPGPTCQRPGCRSPRSCTHSIAETEAILAAAEAQHDMPLTDECSACGAELEFEQAAGWVDAMSGDDGGTYDYCPERRFAGHLPKRHEAKV